MAGSYSLDTSFFMDWQARYYPRDVFGSLDAAIATLIADGRCAAVELVREEIDAVGTPDLRAWAKNNARIFVPLTAELLAAGAAIEAKYPDLLDPKGVYQSADAYVIAQAQMADDIVVTQETSAGQKRNPKKSHFIPDVCRELGIHCIDLLGLARREKWAV